MESRKNMYATVMDITPEAAVEWLKRNVNVRKPSSAVVQRYAEEMRNHWYENGESITFDTDGNLRNGQHRLLAIVKSGVTLHNAVVVWNVDVKEATVYDFGTNRTLVQLALAEGITGLSTQTGGAVGLMLNLHHAAPKTIIKDYYVRDMENWDKATEICRRGAHHALLFKAGVIAAMYCAIRMQMMMKDDLATFAMVANVGLPSGDKLANAPLILRKTLQNGIVDNSGSRLLTGGQFKYNAADVTWQALLDYCNGHPRVKMYSPNGKFADVVATIRNIDKAREAAD